MLRQPHCMWVRTPMLISGTTCPPGTRESVDFPVVASTLSPTCASVAKRPRLMGLCDALPITSTSSSLMPITSPFSVRSGMSTSHRYSGVIVPLAVTINVVFGRRLPVTAKAASVMQCMPAPVSPSHRLLAPVVAIAGMDCMTAVYIARVSAELRRCTTCMVVQRCAAVGDECHEHETAQ
eukprot:4952539-Pleurochrysis_carterae.AAC.2